MEVRSTRITQLLRAAHVPYRLLPHDWPVYTVAEAVRVRGVAIEEMIKSILLRDKDGRYVMACVPGDARLDTKAVRACLGTEWRRLHFASADEIQAVTGCVQGAVAPVGLPAEVPVIFDRSIAQRTMVNISSGDPTSGLELDPHDLIRIAHAQLASIVERADG